MLPLRTLLAGPEPYYGKIVRVRGYFVLAIENTSLLEPEQRRGRVFVDLQRLPATSEDQVFACRLKLVEVQGYVSHVPHRGTERLVIFAEAMASPAK